MEIVGLVEQIVFGVGSIVAKNPHCGCRCRIVLIKDPSCREIFNLVDKPSAFRVHGITGIIEGSTNHNDRSSRSIGVEGGDGLSEIAQHIGRARETFREHESILKLDPLKKTA